MSGFIPALVQTYTPTRFFPLLSPPNHHVPDRQQSGTQEPQPAQFLPKHHPPQYGRDDKVGADVDDADSRRAVASGQGGREESPHGRVEC